MTATASAPASYQRCAKCGSQFADTDASPKCTKCDGLLEIVHTLSASRGAELRARFTARRADGSDGGSGVWRYREIVLPNAGDNIVSVSGEASRGATVRSPRNVLTRYAFGSGSKS